MNGFNRNIEQQALVNENFRHVIYTGRYMQLVVMSLAPGENIGMEMHGNDQFFRFEKGNGKVILDSHEYEVTTGSGVIVPAGCRHNVMNTSSTENLKMYTIYATPHHKDGIEFATKAAASASDEQFDGVTSE